MWFYLKWCVKKKKNTKIQPKKTVCEKVNFGSTKLTKQYIYIYIYKQNRITQYFYNTFINLLNFILTCKELTTQQF